MKVLPVMVFVHSAFCAILTPPILPNMTSSLESPLYLDAVFGITVLSVIRMSLPCTTIHWLLPSFPVPALMVEPDTCAASPEKLTVWNDERPDEEDIFVCTTGVKLLVSLLPFQESSKESSMIFPALVNSALLVTFRFFSSLFSPLKVITLLPEPATAMMVLPLPSMTTFSLEMVIDFRLNDSVSL